MNYNELRDLAFAVAKTDKNAATCFSFGSDETYSAKEANEALVNEFRELCGWNGREVDLYTYKENQNTIFRLISDTITELLPAKVEKQYMNFAEVRTVPNGDKVYFRQRITEEARKRAKTFVTRVAHAGRYEVFMLDGKEVEVKTAAIGYACRVGLEDFLDGRWQFSDFVDIMIEGADEYIYKQVGQALEALINQLPPANTAIVAGFDEDVFDELLAIANAYGKPTIYCTYEFATKILPQDKWVSNKMRDDRWANGYLGNYKGHSVVLLSQSTTDTTNTEKVIDPAFCYIIPSGSDKPVKLAFEGATQVRNVENEDWSTEFQSYMKFGMAMLTNHWICIYKNTNLKKATRKPPTPVVEEEEDTLEEN